MIKRLGVMAVAVLALAACDKPQSSSSGASKDGTLSDKYDRDRDSCRTQVSEYMRGRLLVEDTRRDVMRPDDERYGRSQMVSQMQNYGDTKTYDAAMSDCMVSRGWPQQRSWWQRIGQPHTF